MYVCTYVCMYVCTYVCMYICRYICYILLYYVMYVCILYEENTLTYILLSQVVTENLLGIDLGVPLLRCWCFGVLQSLLQSSQGLDGAERTKGLARHLRICRHPPHFSEATLDVDFSQALCAIRPGAKSVLGTKTLNASASQNLKTCGYLRMIPTMVFYQAY